MQAHFLFVWMTLMVFLKRALHIHIKLLLQPAWFDLRCCYDVKHQQATSSYHALLACWCLTGLRSRTSLLSPTGLCPSNLASAQCFITSQKAGNSSDLFHPESSCCAWPALHPLWHVTAVSRSAERLTPGGGRLHLVIGSVSCAVTWQVFSLSKWVALGGPVMVKTRATCWRAIWLWIMA